MSKFIGLIFGALTFIGLLLFWLLDFGVILAFPLKWSWNYLMPSLLNLPKIDYLQALLLYIICSILFKNNTKSKD